MSAKKSERRRKRGNKVFSVSTITKYFYTSFTNVGNNFLGVSDAGFACNDWMLKRTWIDAKIELFPLIKPHFCQPGIIMVDNLWSAPRKSIRGRFSENMPNMWAGGNHQFTTTHPDLQGKTITELELELLFLYITLGQYFIPIQFVALGDVPARLSTA